jgi:hypothetical protein
MKTNSKEVIELEKMRKKFEEVSEEYLKSWIHLFTQQLCCAEFELLETYINRNTCELFIEFKIVGIRMEAVFQLKNYDEDEGRLDWTGMIRPFDLFSTFEDNYDDEDEDEE